MRPMRYISLTVSGEICSGKSTVSSEIAKKLCWKHLSTGTLFREYCKKHGYDVLDISYLPDEIHKNYDEFVKDMMKNAKNYIFEGRLCGWMARDLKNIFKVFITASLDIRIEREIKREKISYLQAREELLARDMADLRKFQILYDIPDYRNNKFYDTVIDTSNLSVNEVVKIILYNLEEA